MPTLLIPDWELAGILISILFGALLVLPVFYLGKEIFGERVGILSGVIVAVHPFLNSYSGSVLTESTYYFLVAMIVLMGWYAFERGTYQVDSSFQFLYFAGLPDKTGRDRFSDRLWLLDFDRQSFGWKERLDQARLELFS